MQKHKLHIISFDVPYPANYGGVIDVFYKILSLKNEGIGVILHCFQYGREKSQELEKICDRVYYYDRYLNWQHFFSITPFIVKSRRNKRLFQNLMKDDLPIIFEGIHTTAFISELNSRKTFIRAHNIEWEYYKNLFKTETNIFWKVFFRLESIKLRLYEKKTYKDQHVFAISEKDQELLDFYGAKTILLSPFHQNKSIQIPPKTEDYVLYHGNFNVKDNEDAALFFLKLFQKIPIELKIAGFNPSKKIKSLVKKVDNISLIDSPRDELMLQLIKNARLNLFYSAHSSGIKLKLIHALFNAQRCLVSHEYLVNSDLSSLCIAVDEQNWKKVIEDEFNRNFDQKSIKQRKQKLKYYSCSFNVEKLLGFVFE